MTKKETATAFRLSPAIDRIKDVEIRSKVEFDIRQAKLFGVIYLVPTLPEIKVIEDMGFCFLKSDLGYYILPDR